MNSIEIIHAPREIESTCHAEQRSILGGSKLIEQTLRITNIHSYKIFANCFIVVNYGES